MNILVIGSDGIIGRETVRIFTENSSTQVFTFNIPLCDFGQGIKVAESMIIDLDVDVIIYCDRLSGKEGKNPSEHNIFDVNASIPIQIEMLCNLYDKFYVYVSTDCVFSGGGVSFSEISLPNATSLYGRSKYLGEPNSVNSLIVRGSFLGITNLGHQEELIDWYLSSTKPVDGFVNVFWNGVTVKEYGEVIFDCVTAGTRGIQHLSGPTVSKYELLKAIENVFGSNQCSILKKESGMDWRLLRSSKYYFSGDLESRLGMILGASSV